MTSPRIGAGRTTADPSGLAPLVRALCEKAGAAEVAPALEALLVDVLPRSEIARVAGAGKTTVYRHAQEGTLPTFSIGREMYAFREDVLAWARDQGYLEDSEEEALPV